MSDNEMQFTDRYQALGIPYPEAATVCHGQCEGVGCYPQRGDDSTSTPYERAAWQQEHDKAHRLGFKLRMAWRFRSPRMLWEKCDGWHFIKCPDCGGTGKRAA